MIKNHELIPLFSLIAILITVVTYSCSWRQHSTGTQTQTKKAVIQCEMCPENTSVNFDFTMPFEINDDNEILKRIGMDQTSRVELQRSLPPDLFGYCSSMGIVDNIIYPARYSDSSDHWYAVLLCGCTAIFSFKLNNNIIGIYYLWRSVLISTQLIVRRALSPCVAVAVASWKPMKG